VTLHKHTHTLIALINDFYAANELSSKVRVSHCSFDSSAKKKQEGNYIELISFKQNEDYRIWHYTLHFSVIQEKYAATQDLYYTLSEVLRGFASKVNINFAKGCIDVFIAETVTNGTREQQT